ncbi:MAG TPA: ATP-binding cassette domain-containing protein [Streptosporangiaceae bacterium]|nr:ATP-binding cassette domain-containing protein [Streptosporangiaceae bacterium]
MSVLEMRQVSRTYGQGAAEVHALDHIDLSVDSGGMVAVMGPSGSGKSTLLTIAGSLEDPTSGQVVVAGEELIKLSATPRRGCGAGRSASSSRTSTCCPG